jgi:hypothetical protein
MFVVMSKHLRIIISNYTRVRVFKIFKIVFIHEIRNFNFRYDGNNKYGTLV